MVKATHMVVTSSCLARFGVPGYTAYCASKAALLGMVRAFALNWRVKELKSMHCVSAGWIPIWHGKAWMAWQKEWVLPLKKPHDIAMKAVPLRRMSTPKR